MKITPLEIRQKSFERTMRGYDKDEVTAFLVTLSQEWERLLDETKELRIKYEASEKEVSKLREVESSLYKTLKTAEDTGANLIDQANKTAELHLKETQLKAEAMINEAKAKAKSTIEEAEVSSKEMVEEMEERLRELVESYKKLQQHRENLLSDLNRLSNDVADKVERSKKNYEDFNPDHYLVKAKKDLKRIISPNSEVLKTEVIIAEVSKVEVTQVEPVKDEAKPAPAEDTKPVEQPQVATTSSTRSFFDDI